MKRNLLYMTILSSLFPVPFRTFAQEAAGSQAELMTAYVGTYTKKEGHVDGKAEGIYRILQDPQTGSLKFAGTVAEITNPSFVKISPDKKYLYAVSELGPGDGPAGLLHAFRIQADGGLKKLGSLSTRGFAPCHIEVDATGEFVFVSNYAGGVVLYRKDGEELKEMQVLHLNPEGESHPHSVTLSGDNSRAYIADLASDRIWIFDFNSEAGTLSPHQQEAVSLQAGAGPRHLTFSEDQTILYSINELDSTVGVFKVLENGGLELLESCSSLPEEFEGKNFAADIHLHPSGKFLYVSNRGHNSIAAFEVDTGSGNLRNIGFTKTQGKTPRNFAISPSGGFLYAANQDSDNISIFRIEESTGKLVADQSPLSIKTPVCIEFR